VHKEKEKVEQGKDGDWEMCVSTLPECIGMHSGFDVTVNQQ